MLRTLNNGTRRRIRIRLRVKAQVKVAEHHGTETSLMYGYNKAAILKIIDTR